MTRARADENDSSALKICIAVVKEKGSYEKVPKKELTKQLRRDVIITERADDGCSPA